MIELHSLCRRAHILACEEERIILPSNQIQKKNSEAQVIDMFQKHTFLHSQSVQQNYSRHSEDQRACRPHKPNGGLLLFRNAKTS